MFLDYLALWVLFAALVLAIVVASALWGWLSRLFTKTNALTDTLRDEAGLCWPSPPADATDTDATNTDGGDLPQEVLRQWSESGNGRWRRDGTAKWDDDWANEVPEYRGQEVLTIAMEEARLADEAYRARMAEEAQNHQLVLVNVDPATGLGDAVCSCGSDSCDLWLPF